MENLGWRLRAETLFGLIPVGLKDSFGCNISYWAIRFSEEVCNQGEGVKKTIFQGGP